MMKMKQFASACSALTCLLSLPAWAQQPAAPTTTAAPTATATPTTTAAPTTTTGPVEPAPVAPEPESAPTDPTRSSETAAPETATDAPPAEPVAVEPAAVPATEPAPTEVTVPQTPYMKRYVPEHLMAELGVFGGLMFPSKDHQLFDNAYAQSDRQAFKTAGDLGVRFAFFPLSFLGIEAEAAVMPSKLEDGSKGGLWAVRGHGILQWPGASIVPFLVVGGGALGASSNEMGNDVDRAFHFGLGVKAALDEYVSVRLDVRDTLHAGYPDASTAHSPEVLLGISFVPKRRKPDFDKDGVLDMRDQCPSVPGPAQGCPPPDADHDGVPDETDECKDVAGVGPSGCPDQDGDGVLDRDDHCVFSAAPSPMGCPQAPAPVSSAEPASAAPAEPAAETSPAQPAAAPAPSAPAQP